MPSHVGPTRGHPIKFAFKSQVTEMIQEEIRDARD